MAIHYTGVSWCLPLSSVQSGHCLERRLGTCGCTTHNQIETGANGYAILSVCPGPTPRSALPGQPYQSADFSTSLSQDTWSATEMLPEMTKVPPPSFGARSLSSLCFWSPLGLRLFLPGSSQPLVMAIVLVAYSFQPHCSIIGDIFTGSHADCLPGRKPGEGLRSCSVVGMKAVQPSESSPSGIITQTSKFKIEQSRRSRKVTRHV